MNPQLDIIATTISGSITDWGKMKQIVPLFKKHGFDQVRFTECDSHSAARNACAKTIQDGARIIISAGGSGTFNAILEGCCDSGVDLGELSLGFLRKGSADLLGKVLGMPDEIEPAVNVFADAISNQRTIPCDVLSVTTPSFKGSRHFVGYGGLEIFGEIPRFTENRWIKYYKGILGQILGDLGPFGVGATLATIGHLGRSLVGRQRRRWRIEMDGKSILEGKFRTMILVNGDLGPNLPLARGVPLGSGNFTLLTLADKGLHRLPGQIRHTWNQTVEKNPDYWGYSLHRINEELRLYSQVEANFDMNVDGSILPCHQEAQVTISDQIKLICSSNAIGYSTG